MLRVSAPRLEELALLIPLGCTPRSLEVDGDLPCVRNLKLCLWSHLPPDPPDGEAENDAGMLLLKHCSSVTCLHITLDGRKVRPLDHISQITNFEFCSMHEEWRVLHSIKKLSTTLNLISYVS